MSELNKLYDPRFWVKDIRNVRCINPEALQICIQANGNETGVANDSVLSLGSTVLQICNEEYIVYRAGTMRHVISLKELRARKAIVTCGSSTSYSFLVIQETSYTTRIGSNLNVSSIPTIVQRRLGSSLR